MEKKPKTESFPERDLGEVNNFRERTKIELQNAGIPLIIFDAEDISVVDGVDTREHTGALRFLNGPTVLFTRGRDHWIVKSTLPLSEDWEKVLQKIYGPFSAVSEIGHRENGWFVYTQGGLSVLVGFFRECFGETTKEAPTVADLINAGLITKGRWVTVEKLGSYFQKKLTDKKDRQNMFNRSLERPFTKEIQT